ncbi:MAG: hypothetical protein KDI30_00640, partial [Pseudomonadales bacterium]|nr:hypothetical protein [Pseudomonadales bacterium]
LEIIDQGSLHSQSQQQVAYSPASGLGLYIVHLICEAIGWRYELVEMNKLNCIRLFYAKPAS